MYLHYVHYVYAKVSVNLNIQNPLLCFAKTLLLWYNQKRKQSIVSAVWMHTGGFFYAVVCL